MHLSDCVCKESSRTELLLVYSDAAYEAAKLARDRMTQAILPIDQSYILEEELEEVLGNDDCQSLIAALGVGVMLGGQHASSERIFDMTKLRYGKIIVVTEQGELERSASHEVIRFFSTRMRPLVDAGHLFVLEPPLGAGFTQNDFVEHVLDTATRRLRIVASEDTLENPVDKPD